MLTRRENLLRVLHGERPAWVPCALNLWQWYGHHQRCGTLPPELQGTRDQVDALRVLGCDIFSRNCGGGVRGELPGAACERTEEPGVQGLRHVTTIRTPHGLLRGIVEDQIAAATSYAVEDTVKEWSRDGQAYLWLLEQMTYRWDAQAFADLDVRIGDDGLVLVSIGQSPLKKLHMDFGLEYASLFVLDEPDAARACCDLYWGKLWPAIQQVADHPGVAAAILMDNFDTPFYPPSICEQFWTPYVRQAADLFAARGKQLFVHACGKLRQSMGTFREAGIHGLEGMAHPPLGDFAPQDAWQMPEGFIYNGGFSAHEQVSMSDAQVEAFYARFFADLKGRPAFIFGSACQTTITTSWARIKRVVELCRHYGGAVPTQKRSG